MHDEIRELLGVYALDALDPEERDQVESHLIVCPSCRDEVAEHQEVVAMIGSSDPIAPSDSWSAIASRISGPSFSIEEVAAAAPNELVAPLWRRPRLVLAAAAVLVLALGSALVAQTLRLSNARSDQTAGLDGVVAEALQDSTTELMTLASESSETSALVAFRPDGTGYVVRHTLPALSPDRTYQLWAVVDGTVISAGVLGPDPGIVPFRIDPEGLAAFAITEEQAGGVVTSENDAVVVWLAA